MKNTFAKMGALTALALTLSAGFPARAEDPKDILVVVNKSASLTTTLSPEALRNLFLLYRTSFEGGGRAVIINAKNGTPLREDFRRKVLDMSQEEELRYWQERKVRSGQIAPAEFSNPLKAVFKIKGAVGYVYRSQYREGVVDVVLVIPAGGS